MFFLQRENVLATPIALRKPKRLMLVGPPDVFIDSLHRECARVDRNAGQFSLVMLRTDGGNLAAARRLSKLALARARSTDELGWVDQDWLGILLPDTALCGGRSLALYLCNRLNESSDHARARVFSYPAHWISLEDDQKLHALNAETLAAYANQNTPMSYDKSTHFNQRPVCGRLP